MQKVGTVHHISVLENMWKKIKVGSRKYENQIDKKNRITIELRTIWRKQEVRSESADLHVEKT